MNTKYKIMANRLNINERVLIDFFNYVMEKRFEKRFGNDDVDYDPFRDVIGIKDNELQNWKESRFTKIMNGDHSAIELFKKDTYL